MECSWVCVDVWEGVWDRDGVLVLVCNGKRMKFALGYAWMSGMVGIVMVFESMYETMRWFALGSAWMFGMAFWIAMVLACWC